MTDYPAEPVVPAAKYAKVDVEDRGAANIMMNLQTRPRTNARDLVGKSEDKGEDNVSEDNGNGPASSLAVKQKNFESLEPAEPAQKKQLTKAQLVRRRQILLQRRQHQRRRIQEQRRIRKFRRQAVLAFARNFLDGKQREDVQQAAKQSPPHKKK